MSYAEFYRKKYGTTGIQEPADISYVLTRWQHFSALNDVIAAISKVWLQIENVTPSTNPMCVYLKNLRAKFHPDPIWNDEALGLY